MKHAVDGYLVYKYKQVAAHHEMCGSFFAENVIILNQTLCILNGRKHIWQTKQKAVYTAMHVYTAFDQLIWMYWIMPTQIHLLGHRILDIRNPAAVFPKGCRGQCLLPDSLMLHHIPNRKRCIRISWSCLLWYRIGKSMYSYGCSLHKHWTNAGVFANMVLFGFQESLFHATV